MSRVDGEGEKSLEDLMNTPISYLDFLAAEIFTEVDQLRSYANAVEQMLVEQSNKADDEFQEKMARKSAKAREALVEWYVSDHLSFTRDYPKILRYSLFVHSYHLLEHILLDIANHYRQTRHLPSSPSNIKRDIIKGLRNYLKKDAFVPFPNTQSWQDITTLQSIRNLIVHHEGEIGKDDEKELQTIGHLAKKWKGDIAIKDGSIELSQNFISRVLDTFNVFFKELLAKLPET